MVIFSQLFFQLGDACEELLLPALGLVLGIRVRVDDGVSYAVHQLGLSFRVRLLIGVDARRLVGPPRHGHVVPDRASMVQTDRVRVERGPEGVHVQIRTAGLRRGLLEVGADLRSVASGSSGQSVYLAMCSSNMGMMASGMGT